MKRCLLSFLLVLSTLLLSAQDYKVISMNELMGDMSARENIKTDENNRQCALIRIATQNITPEMREGFFFECDYASYVVERALVKGEIWIWVSPGLKTLRISHLKWGQYEVHTNAYVTKIESLHTYKMVIQGTMSDPDGNPLVTQQFLVFNVTPDDAMVTVNGDPWPVVGGVAQKMVDFGTYRYYIDAPDYHATNGKVEVNDTKDKVTVNVELTPAFGFLKITGDMEVLQEATVYVDGRNGSEAVRGSKRLGNGTHDVRIIDSRYLPYEQTVEIVEGQTYNLYVELEANYATVTLQVDSDAAIYVNDQFKGHGSWTGNLGAGNYNLECRKNGCRTTRLPQTITKGMMGDTIQLEAPKPVKGVLAVSSNPTGATIYIDGENMGETPMRITTVLIGEHKLLLEKQGCAPLTKTIVIPDGTPLNVDEHLDTGCNITVRTMRIGDKVYVDGEYAGEAPVFKPLGYGSHAVTVVRGEKRVEKTVEVVSGSRDMELFVEFGRLVTINTDREGDNLFIDGSDEGYSPLMIEVPVGKHLIHAERGKKYADLEIDVPESGGNTTYQLTLHSESATHYAEKGVNFVTLNLAYSPSPQVSYGATFGSVRKLGWFVTAMNNFDFMATNYSMTASEEGLVDGFYYDYTGDSYSTRLSVMAGMIARIAGPVCMRFGAGYGMRVKSWSTAQGELVRFSNDSFTGVDATMGMQLNLKGFVVSLDAVTTNFQTVEAKVGFGYCWNKRQKK